MSRDFIATEYPWFLSTYDSYSFPIQRVDTVRYFILRHYGGIYMDLDNVSFILFRHLSLPHHLRKALRALSLSITN